VLKVFNFKGSLPYVILIIGIICYIVGLGDFLDISLTIRYTINQVLIGLGNLFVVGVLIGFMTSYLQDKQIYRKVIEEIMYTEDFLNKRSDIENIWKITSKSLFNSKFPEISNDLLELINKYYFPQNRNSYYKDFTITIKLTWDPDQKHIITKSNYAFNLISYCKEEIKLPLKSWNNYQSDDSGKYDKISNFTFNGKKLTDDELEKYKIEEKECDNNILLTSYEIPISGSNKYQISYERNRKHIFDEDTDTCYRANYIVNGLTVNLFYPDNIEAKLICRGTLEDFINVGSSKGQMVYKYDGFILPRQGYVIVLKKIE